MRESPRTSDADRARGIAAERLATAGRVTALTGAGISTDSGLPDFRGPQGLWTRDPAAERLSDITSYEADAEVRRRVWRGHLRAAAAPPQPNAAHRALVEIERAGRLGTLVTQNVDGLHHAAGHDPAKVIEIHGHLREVGCLRCHERQPMAAALERVAAGDDDPRCDACGGVLKAATVSFGQPLSADDLRRATQAASEADLFLAVGTSLAVFPVASLPQIALDAGVPVVIVNGEPTPYDDTADAVVRGRIGELLPEIVAAALRAG